MTISVDAYHLMQESGMAAPRAELIRGVIIEKMSKSPLHTGLTFQLRELLYRWAGNRFWVRKEAPLTPADSEPAPDVSIVRGLHDEFSRSHPTTAVLVVEVSVTTESADRELLPAYALAGVEEVWLVLALKQQIVRSSQPSGDVYAESVAFGIGEVLPSLALQGFTLPVSDLFTMQSAS